MTEKKPKPASVLRKFIIALAVIIVVSLIATGIFYYLRLWGPNVTGKEEYLYIRTGSTFDDVYNQISEKHIVNDSTSFKWAAYNMHYINNVKPGKYRLHEGMSNRKLISILRLGLQEPVVIAIKNIRLKEDFAGFMGKKVEADSTSLINLMDSSAYINQFGFTPENVYTMVLPNTYQFKWNGSARKVFSKLYAEYQKFWTPERRLKASEMKLDPIKVTILASIVDAEALHDSEMPIIAGLYLNRMKKGMKLESDPTVIFALHDFTIHRVLRQQLETNSPYNTYAHTGLPPGPIMMPSLNAINAVLDYQHNDYIYMCAKPDFSGYTNFTNSLAQHQINAHAFQEALNKRKIER
jgi:UPF0755 protein